VGMTIRAIITYMPCFYIGKPFIDRWGRYISLKWKGIAKMDKKFENTKKRVCNPLFVKNNSNHSKHSPKCILWHY